MELLAVLATITIGWFLLRRRRRGRGLLGGVPAAALVAALCVAGWIGYRAVVAPQPRAIDYAEGDTALRALLDQTSRP